MLHHHFGRLEEAEQAYCRVLDNQKARHFASVDRGIHGFKTRHNLALVYEDLDRLDAAEEQWRRIVADVPAYRLGWRGLIESLLRQEKVEEATEAIGKLIGCGTLSEGLQAERLMLQSWTATAAGDLAAARRHLHEAVSRWPDDPDAKHALCRFLFERVDPIEAESPLQDLLRLTPNDGAVHHNLGLIRLRKREYPAAVHAFQESLRYRPDSPTTQEQLALAIAHCGQNLSSFTAVSPQSADGAFSG